MLPPGEWDPHIRLEPPEKVPSQEPRRTGMTIRMSKEEDEEEEEEELDEALKMTGKLFGGLILDVKRKLPFFISDFKDALNFQCLASFIFLFLASLAPTIIFGGIMGESVDHWMVCLFVLDSSYGLLFFILRKNYELVFFFKNAKLQ